MNQNTLWGLPIVEVGMSFESVTPTDRDAVSPNERLLEKMMDDIEKMRAQTKDVPVALCGQKNSLGELARQLLQGVPVQVSGELAYAHGIRFVGDESVPDGEVWFVNRDGETVGKIVDIGNTGKTS